METKDIYGPGNDNYGRDKHDNEAIIQHIQNALKLTSKEPSVVLCPNCGSSSEVYASLGKCHCANCGKLWNFDNSESTPKQELVKTAEEILSKHSNNYGESIGNPRAIIKATEAIEAMKEYASQLPKSVLPSDEEIEKLLTDYELYCKTFVSKEFIKNFIKQRNNGK